MKVMITCDCAKIDIKNHSKITFATFLRLPIGTCAVNNGPIPPQSRKFNTYLGPSFILEQHAADFHVSIYMHMGSIQRPYTLNQATFSVNHASPNLD